MKMILSSAFSSGILLFGISLVYGTTGTVSFDALPGALNGNTLQILAFVFLFTALLTQQTINPIMSKKIIVAAIIGLCVALYSCNKGSDSTAAGTVLVKSFSTGIEWYNSPAMTNVNGTLYFFANDGTHGLELWKSDGTEAGTVMVKDCNPGSGSSIRTYARVNLAAVGNRLFWNAYDPDHGDELWVSDGTEAGTWLVEDLVPGTGSSVPAIAVCSAAARRSSAAWAASRDRKSVV